MSLTSDFQRTIQSFDSSGIRVYDRSRTWITFPASQPAIAIDELYLKNGAHVALEPNPSASISHELETQTMIAEGFILNKAKLGVLHVGPHQKIIVR